MVLQLDVDEREVLVADAELELAHGFDEGGGLDVSDSSTKLNVKDQDQRQIQSEFDAYLDDANVRLLPRVVDRDLRHALDPVLDRIRDVRNDLR